MNIDWPLVGKAAIAAVTVFGAGFGTSHFVSAPSASMPEKAAPEIHIKHAPCVCEFSLPDIETYSGKARWRK